MNQVAGALNLGDEPRGAYDNTQFELYGPGVAAGPGTASPAPGTGIAGTQITFPPGAPAVPEAWVRYWTLSPVTCGTYLLRTAVSNDDDNGWRLRVGLDNDADPTNAPPANSDNPDGIPGTNDELIVGQTQISYQQDTGGVACLTLHEYVSPGLASVTMHNFDMDGNTRVRYYGPSDTYDPTGSDRRHRRDAVCQRPVEPRHPGAAAVTSSPIRRLGGGRSSPASARPTSSSRRRRPGWAPTSASLPSPRWPWTSPTA